MLVFKRMRGTLAIDAAPRAAVNGPTLEVVREVHHVADCYHSLAVGVGGAAGESGPVDGLDAEEIGLPYAQRQAGLGYRGDVAQRGPIHRLRAAGGGADGILIAANAALVVGAGIPVGRQLRGGTGGGDIRSDSVPYVGRRTGRRYVRGLHRLAVGIRGVPVSPAVDGLDAEVVGLTVA